MEQPDGKRRKAPAANAAPRKRQSKKAADGAGTADGAGQGTTPPGKKPRAIGAKGKGTKADKASADDDLELVAKDEGKVVDDEAEEKLGKVHSGVFSKDLPWLMYGFGDADKPLKETVDLVEDIAVQYITDTVHAAMRAAAARSAGAAGATAAARKDELKLEDLLYAVRRDPRKVARVQELIRRQQEIKDARKAVEIEGMPEDMPD